MTSHREGNRPAESASLRSPSTSRDTSPTLARAISSASTSGLRKQPSINLTSSTGNSPQTSRNTSPIRPAHRTETPQTTTRIGGAGGGTGQRSRKNSHDATSPSRPPVSTPPTHTVPSAAAIQRALSATSIPQLQPSIAEAVSKLPRTARAGASAETTPTTGTFSPRVKSPPPSAPISRRNSIQKGQQPPPPPITIQSSTPTTPDFAAITKADSPAEKDQLRAPPKAPSRGPSGPKSNLETVQENTPPSSAVLANATDSSFSSMNTNNKSSDEERRPAARKNDEGPDKALRNIAVESESDGNKSDSRGRRQEHPTMSSMKPRIAPAKTVPPLSARSRASAGESSRNMTVETETVTSIPQSQLNADRSAGRGDASGSIRLKPSTETIRPKKERKRVSRKAPSIHNGTASSKADIFEARVASAVDQANSSDSDETFVYESNPPEPQHRARNHSRTPSATSMHSQATDRRGLRSYLDNHRVAGKRSMKFSNNPYNLLDSPPDGDSGTVRAHPRHMSRFGRTVGSNGSIYDQDSPFTQASKLRSNVGNSSRQTSRPTTPQTPRTAPLFGNTANARGNKPWNKRDDLSQYDYEGEGADDERTPLVSTVRTPRNRQYPRRMNSNNYQHIYSMRDTSWTNRFGGFLLGLIVVCLIVIGAASFLVMSNKTMYNVEVQKIQNVLASEQELMLDLLVGAVNPNVIGISVMDMDINIFAKSKHLSEPTTSSLAAPSATGTTLRYAARHATHDSSVEVAGTPWQDPSGHWHDGDDGQDGGGELEGDSQTMLLGRIFRFDQALYFEGSPIKRHTHYSVGEMRLAKPGNRTEAGGSARWERVIQYPFELILRGVVRYQMPISNKPQSAAISGSIIVHPEEGVDSYGRMRVEEVDQSERWQWIEHDDHKDIDTTTKEELPQQTPQ